MEKLFDLPPNILVWLSPLLFIFLIVYTEQKNNLLKQSIDHLKEAIDKLTEVLDKQEGVLDDYGERLVKVEMQVSINTHDIEKLKGDDGHA